MARHIRTLTPNQYITDPTHMPHEQRFYREWSPERIRSWGAKIGPNTELFMDRIIQSKPHPEHGFRACRGIIRLARSYTPERLERAAYRAMEFNLNSYKSIKSMMDKGLDTITLFDPQPVLVGLDHQNIRGGAYYAAEH